MATFNFFFSDDARGNLNPSSLRGLIDSEVERRTRSDIEPTKRLIELAAAKTYDDPPILVKNPYKFPKNEALVIVGKVSSTVASLSTGSIKALLYKLDANEDEVLLDQDLDGITVGIAGITINGSDHKFDFKLKFDPEGGNRDEFPLAEFVVYVTLEAGGDVAHTKLVRGEFI